MREYFIGRVLQMIPVLLLVSMISFALLFLLPGDPALLILGDQQASNQQAYEALRRELGLDQPVPLQYLNWLGKTVRGDLGVSTRDRQPVVDGLRERLPVTLELAALAMLLAVVIAIPTGIISAVRPNSWLDRILSVLALSGVAIPNFWLGILLIYGLAVIVKVLPPSGFVPFAEDPGRNLKHLILPAITLGLGLAAVIMRQMRSALLEVLQQDYVTTARAKGLGERRVVLRHALKNALIPVNTIVGLQLGLLFGGAVLTESIFSIPGVGRWSVDSILQRDFPVVQAVCLVLALGVLSANLLTDFVYAFVDPRIRRK
jgi:peptide/nickel transport system permease protein